jgi:hypothetical protein
LVLPISHPFQFLRGFLTIWIYAYLRPHVRPREHSSWNWKELIQSRRETKDCCYNWKSPTGWDWAGICRTDPGGSTIDWEVNCQSILKRTIYVAAIWIRRAFLWFTV